MRENTEIREDFSHNPVMLGECMDALDIKPDGNYMDCTGGGGGHSTEIARRLLSGTLTTLDRDAEAVFVLTKRMAEFGERVRVIQSNFADAAEYADKAGLDGVLMDLGVSSHQLDTPERGFSYMKDAPLDMRMDQNSAEKNARDVVNSYSHGDLKRILYEYGEEKFAPKIASAIVSAREAAPIETTVRLAEIIKGAIPAPARAGGHHPAKKSFQAIRIEVNGELDVIAPAILSLAEKMKSGGRIAVITFHSLEDRIVKKTFASMCRPCTCPPSFPVCVCGKKPLAEPVSGGVITASENELSENPRSRSAKLRFIRIL